MSIKNRPYVGSWEMGTQSVVRYTPDAKVLINGHTELAVCATCGHKTDFNKYITTITCDVSVEPISTASLTLVVPRHDADVFSHDGNYVLHPGLEVVILMRGYFPVTGYAMKGQEGASDETSETDSADDDVPVYPYYQVFRGVVTEASHEFSGGFYTASLTCSSILHFWQYLYINTHASVFGDLPENSGGGIDLSGHQFTEMSPYGIMYTLMRVGFGAAFGQNWTISQATNIAAIDESSGQSLYKHAALWWEKQWQRSDMRFRMYGFDGSMFNFMEQAFLGMFDNKNTNTSQFLASFNIETPDNYNPGALASRQAIARTYGYRGTETTGAIMSEDGSKLDALKMQAYTLDLGRMGSVNMFEGEYMSKLEIANAVREIVGFEFYQDVDGDIVFKPPFYNLDTSGDEVYCIRDRDLISISESEREPEATYVKGSGSLFQNFQGLLSGAFGTREARFADWRLIAKFGWREVTFESHYYSGAKQMFIGAIMRLDVANAEMRSAQITIPMRPELRPGYPVWVEHLDCFFYAKSISHSFAPGSSAQTNITGCAKRAKWLPPGLPDRSEGAGSQNLPRLSDMRLGLPGEYPPMPLYVFPEDLEGAEEGASGPPRIMGLPNVVMALDPDKINPAKMPGGIFFSSADSYFDVALTLGALRRGNVPGQYLIAVSDDPNDDIVITKEQVSKGFTDYAAAYGMSSGDSDESEFFIYFDDDDDTTFGSLVAAVLNRTRTAIPDADHLNNYMGLQRNLKNVFGSGARKGEYRYYTSSLPTEFASDQSPSTVRVDMETGTVTKTFPGGPVDANFTGLTTLTQDGDRIKVGPGMPLRGFRVYGFAPPATDEDEDWDASQEIGHVDVTTRDIRFVTFQKITIRVEHVRASLGSDPLMRLLLDQESVQYIFLEVLRQTALQPPDRLTLGAEDRFSGASADAGYGLIWAALMALRHALRVDTAPTYVDAGGVKIGSPLNPPKSLEKFENAFTQYSYSTRTRGEGTVTVTWSYASEPHTEGELPRGAPVPPSDLEGFIRAEGMTNIAYTKTRRPIISRTVTKRGALGAATPHLIPKDVSLQVGMADPANRGLTGVSDAEGAESLAVACANALSLQFMAIQNAFFYATGEPTTEEEAAYDTFLETMIDLYDIEITRDNDGKTKILSSEYKESDAYSVVLPVSDNRGYEVYGTLAYGRGLNIDSYQTLLSQRGSPTATESMLAVERYFAAEVETKGAEVSIVLGVLSAEQRAELAVALEVENVAALEGAITALKAGSTSESIFVRNNPVTTSSRGQSLTLALSAEELASLTVGDTTICLCKGAEASHWLQAFTGEFVELAGDEAVNDFLIQEVVAAEQGYVFTKQALAGEMMDLSSGNKLAQTIQVGKSGKDAIVTAALGAFDDVVSEFGAARDEVVRNAQSIAQAVLDPLNPDAIRSESQGTVEQEQARESEAEDNLNQSVSPPLSYRPVADDDVSEKED